MSDNLPANTDVFKIMDGTKIITNSFYNKKSIQHEEKIKDKIWDSYSKIKVIYIPESVEYIDDNAFCDCDQLIYIFGGNRLKYIGNFVFEFCPIKHFILLDSIIKLAPWTVSNLEDLETIYMPKNLVTINADFFEYVDHLKNVYVHLDNCDLFRHLTLPKNCKSVVVDSNWTYDLEVQESNRRLQNLQKVQEAEMESLRVEYDNYQDYYSDEAEWDAFTDGMEGDYYDGDPAGT